MNNLKTVFDSIVGFNGSASTEGWRDMTYSDLKEAIVGQADSYNYSLSGAEEDIIASAVIAYRECDNSSDAWHVRKDLEN